MELTVDFHFPKKNVNSLSCPTSPAPVTTGVEKKTRSHSVFVDRGLDDENDLIANDEIRSILNKTESEVEYVVVGDNTEVVLPLYEDDFDRSLKKQRKDFFKKYFVSISSKK